MSMNLINIFAVIFGIGAIVTGICTGTAHNIAFEFLTDSSLLSIILMIFLHNVYVSKTGKPSVNYRASGDGYTGDSYEEEFCFPNETELLSYVTTKELKK